MNAPLPLDLFPTPELAPEAPFVEGRERTYRGSFAQVRALLPEFDRVAFTPRPGTGTPRRLEVVLRRADRLQGLPELPVGVLPAREKFVCHHDVLDVLREALAAAGVDPVGVDVEARLHHYGARLMLSVTLPPAFTLEREDAAPVALRMVGFNAVDRSSPLRIAVGWFRFASSHGPLVGTTLAELRQRPREGLRRDEVRKIVAHGLASATAQTTVH